MFCERDEEEVMGGGEMVLCEQGEEAMVLVNEIASIVACVC